MGTDTEGSEHGTQATEDRIQSVGELDRFAGIVVSAIVAGVIGGLIGGFLFLGSQHLRYPSNDFEWNAVKAKYEVLDL